jgi:DNA-binding NtrC family response regulator
MASHNNKVLSVGADPELLWLRNAALQSAGLNVLTTSDENDALTEIRQGECGVLVLCDSLSDNALRRLTETFRRCCPAGRIVAITNKPVPKAETADTFVYGVEGPEALIKAIRNQ